MNIRQQLSQAQAHEKATRRAAIQHLDELREIVERELQGLEKADGLHDAADVFHLRRAFNSAIERAENHARDYAQVVELEQAVERERRGSPQ